MNRSYECSEEAVKELDEARIVYSLRSALNRQKAFGGPSTGSRRTECWIFPSTTRGVLDFPVHGVLDFPVRGEPFVRLRRIRRALSNHRPPPEHDAIYATNFRVGTIESGLAMMLEIAIRCVT